MAEIVFAGGISHSPMLSASVAGWLDAGEKESQHPDLGAFLPGPLPGYAAELDEQRLHDRHARIAREVEAFSSTLASSGWDTLVIMGDDQGEAFPGDGLVPALAVYAGDAMVNHPEDCDEATWRASGLWGYRPLSTPERYRVDAAMGTAVAEGCTKAGFDIAVMHTWPQRPAGHAFAFVYRRLIADRDRPCLPVMINTHFGPNRPTPARCFAFGQALAGVLARYEGCMSVAVLASGGLSHPLLDAALDQRFLAALEAGEWPELLALGERDLRFGSSEIRNWCVLAGVLSATSLGPVSSAYIPAYRTPQGTGCGLAFATCSPRRRQ